MVRKHCSGNAASKCGNEFELSRLSNNKSDDFSWCATNHRSEVLFIPIHKIVQYAAKKEHLQNPLRLEIVFQQNWCIKMMFLMKKGALGFIYGWGPKHRPGVKIISKKPTSRRGGRESTPSEKASSSPTCGPKDAGCCKKVDGRFRFLLGREKESGELLKLIRKAKT